MIKAQVGIENKDRKIRYLKVVGTERSRKMRDMFFKGIIAESNVKNQTRLTFTLIQPKLKVRLKETA